MRREFIVAGVLIPIVGITAGLTNKEVRCFLTLDSEGGLIHWTHHDPAGNRIEGWIKHEDKIYQ